jgi:hypothetical protein
VDSAAIALLICRGDLPTPDYAYMTDNGYDGTWTWDYVERILKPNLRAAGVTLHIIKTTDYSSTNIIDNGMVRIPAYALQKDGQVVKLATRCSQAWKMAPALKWLREMGIKRCINMIGIAADESRRVKESPRMWIKNWYPLVDMNLARHDCKKLLLSDHDWSIPNRSSCIFCPQKKDSQWIDLRDNYPAEWQRVIEIEKVIHVSHPHIFLHRSCRPLSEVRFVGGGFVEIFSEAMGGGGNLCGRWVQNRAGSEILTATDTI